MLCDLGYRPRLDLDGLVGDTVAFSAASGGVVEDTGASDRWRVRRSTVELLEMLDADPVETVTSDAEVVRRANRLLAAWIRELLGADSVPMRLLFGS